MQHGPPYSHIYNQTLSMDLEQSLQPQIWGCIFSANLRFVFVSNAITNSLSKSKLCFFFLVEVCLLWLVLFKKQAT